MTIIARLIASLAGLWCAFGASADVLYVPQWELANTPSPPTNLDGVRWRGLVALDLPSLREIGRWPGLPAAEVAVISSDERWLFLFSSLNGVPGTDGALHVVDRTTMQVVASWPAFAAGMQLGFARTPSAETAIAHPTRPRVITFAGLWWFDSETGQWIETPATTGLPAGISAPTLMAPRLGGEGRWISLLSSQSPTSGSYTTLLVDTANPRNQRSFPTSPPGTIVAFDGTRYLRPVALATYGVFDLATDTELRRVAVPDAIELYVDQRGGALFYGNAAGSSVVRRLASADAALELLIPPQPIGQTLAWQRVFPRSTLTVLAGARQAACIDTITICGNGIHELEVADASGAIVATSTTESVGNTVRWFTAGGAAIAGGLPGAPSAVPATNAGWIFVLAVLVIAALARRRFGTAAPI